MDRHAIIVLVYPWRSSSILPRNGSLLRDDFELLGMSTRCVSRCYKESKGELGCISCHDPHTLPEPADRIADDQKRCLECHAKRGCSLTAEVRLKKSPQDDCVSCHMSTLPGSTVGHSAITDHRILRTPD